MTEYWISTPRKFCEFCKCWITDNKPSVDFHERGKRHQENVKIKISEVRKKGQEVYEAKKQEENDIATMEAAALAAVQNDISNDPSLAAAYGMKLNKETVAEKDDDLRTNIQVETAKKCENTGKAVDLSDWQEAQTSEGYTYYWNEKTRETKWELPTTEAADSKKEVKPAKPVSTKRRKKEAKRESGSSTSSKGKSTVKKGPYGAWETIEEPEPEPLMDLQLPVVKPSEMILPEFTEPAKRSVSYKEKTVTSLAPPGGSTSKIVFKKRKLASGAQNIRRKEDS
ncbi:PREDICTED: WW domain-binding protein 4-like isoform X1 [Priapulus caudatus]|uniref:WW domain-binding protein 4-like isoform X1 n=1 Tax=Priapulus caudatus TaxID=37621 RepID=A0ABM1EJW0_PRICU|nr:PREDICTED: WW domain-binding protein 4-like isoform X1 [Priapulus caudatus]